jgi:hypothetical protein
MECTPIPVLYVYGAVPVVHEREIQLKIPQKNGMMDRILFTATKNGMMDPFYCNKTGMILSTSNK